MAEKATEKKVAEKKVLTAEELAQINAAIEVLKQSGLVSEDFAQVLKLVPNWHDTEANKEIKKEVIESFNSSEEFKNYIDGEFQEELKNVVGFARLASILNNIKSFYARRESKGARKPKVKTTVLNIKGTAYNVSVELLKQVKADESLSQEDKFKALLEDANTTKVEVVDVL
jgi:hypothetical protein|nr:MAG TPA: hypothetical protein [Caudoviricetes sp.]